MQSPDDDIATRPSRFPWPPVLLIGAIALAALLQRIVPLPWPGLDDMIAKVIGYGIGAAGVILGAWAVIEMRRARANVLPHRAATTLVETGPFRIWRNPIYMADVLILLGLAQLTLNIWFAILAPVFALAVFKLAIEPEERHLAAVFGDTYIDYAGRTRRWF